MFRNEQPTDSHETSHDERGIPQVGRKRKGNKYVLLLGLGVGITAAIGLGANAVLEKLRNRGDARGKPQTAERGLPDLTRDAFNAKNAPPPPPSAAAEKAAASAGPTGMSAEQKAALDLAERRKRAPLRLLSAGQTGTANGAGDATLASVSAPGGSRTTSSLSSALSATRTAEAAA